MDKVKITDNQLDAVSGGSVIPYIVQQGDTLKALADHYHVTVEELMKWNNIKDPNMLLVGQQLKIKF